MSDLRQRLEGALGERYELADPVGEGGMAFVFAAHDAKHGRSVAIKVLKPEVATALGSERFLREIENAARCTHPNILPLHDSGADDDLVWFVMPLVDGPSLEERMEAGRLSRDEALRLVGQIAEALAYAHDAGLVHRDVKPGNILLVSGQATVTDFGIARALGRTAEGSAKERLTQTGFTLGTTAYMSPEQADGGEVDGRADQYALACLAWELLSGRRLFEGMGPMQILSRKATEEIFPPGESEGIPASILAVLRRATSVDPERRFPDMAAFRRALASAATAEEMLRVESSRRRRGQFRIVAGIAALAALGGALWWAGGLTSQPSHARFALLPLENRGSVGDAFFVEGMHEALIAELQEAGLEVIGRRSVMRFEDDRTTSVRAIADSLGTDAILEGDAYRRADSVGITLRLLDGATEVQVWQRDFAGPARRVLDLYRDATVALAEEVGFELPEEVRRRLAQRDTIDPRAYEAYVRGRFHWNRLTPNDLDLAEENFGEALRLEPDYAAAHAGTATLAAARNQMGLLPPEVAVPQWQAGVDAALAADSSNVPAWGALGGLQGWGYWDWEASRASHERALELNPSDAQNRAYYAHVLHLTGDPEGALREMDRAEADDPLNTLVLALGCSLRSSAAELEVGEAACREAIARDPANPVANHGLLNLAFRRADWTAYAEVTASTAAAMGSAEVATAIRGNLSEGPRVALRRTAELLEAAAEEQFVQPTLIVSLYSASDTPERALPWIDRAIEVRDPAATYFGTWPMPEVIARSDELEAALAVLGLPNQLVQ